jgi:hypothetical protein
MAIPVTCRRRPKISIARERPDPAALVVVKEPDNDQRARKLADLVHVVNHGDFRCSGDSGGIHQAKSVNVRFSPTKLIKNTHWFSVMHEVRPIFLEAHGHNF